MNDTPAAVAEAMRALWTVFGAVVGACLGSFANVVVARVPAGQSVVHPPSRCPSCGTPIQPWHNLPVVSWLWLRGKARCCGIPISPRYVAVEALGLFLGWAVMVMDGPGPQAVVHGLGLLFLVCVALIDAEHWVIPRGLSLGLIPVGILGGALVTAWHGADMADAWRLGAWPGVKGALIGFGVLFAVRKVATAWARRTGRVGPDEEAQGEGDEHLLAGIGALLGPAGVWWALTLGSLQGSVASVLLLARARARGQDVPQADPVKDPSGEDEDWTPPPGAIPFGPFLALAAIEVIFIHPWLPNLDLSLVLEAFRSVEP